MDEDRIEAYTEGQATRTATKMGFPSLLDTDNCAEPREGRR